MSQPILIMGFKWRRFLEFSSLLFYFLSLLSVCGALTLSRVIIPSYKLAGETATLECPYELNRNRERLYAVKWYKDNEEFYRYVPMYSPPVRSFDKLDGVRVQIGGSDAKQVTLQNLDLRSTGVYRCEVSAEAPSFTSVHGEGRLTVVHLPEGGKVRIEGKVKGRYEVGDELNFTCSAGKSFPPVKLSWYINDLPVPPEEVLDLSPRPLGHHHLTPSLSQLKVKLGGEHFREEGETKVLCKANSWLPNSSWNDGDERTISSSRKSTDFPRSSINSFNVSPVLLFEEHASLTIKGGAYSTHPGSPLVLSLITLILNYFHYHFC